MHHYFIIWLLVKHSRVSNRTETQLDCAEEGFTCRASPKKSTTEPNYKQRKCFLEINSVNLHRPPPLLINWAHACTALH